MNDRTTPPLDEIRALVAERSRFEGWLSTLESRRDATPAHVFDRVRQDYDARRQRVVEQLTAHVGALQAAVAGLDERHGALGRALGERRDALAEVELRALVGEFGDDEGARQRAEVEAAIADLEREAEGVGRELDEVRELASQVGAPAPEPAEPEPAAVATSVGEPPSAARGDDGYGQPSAPTGAAEIMTAPAPEPRPTPAFGSPLLGGDPRRDTPVGSPSFVGGQGLAQAAMGVPMAPPDDTPAGAAAQKTLKCQECGAMNFPTEWYCERCGGELAAL
ncbi:hypothetical protein [Roseisolibacter sp. H3M3-2]|uniref:zinc finger Ran-binding domain-containing protein n=1 Tax=Roseisolibacter sp. H3M3-2 TaxID=3031323 RepID=UPI0023DC6BAB|nr:hypothetical protein [Roseisolibacter sp. H3M3-2]MDF1502250.1 hypothetical protein [Roseisolibacter sp. H3M3-2]